MSGSLTIAAARTPTGILDEGAALHPDRPLLVYEDVDGDVVTFSWAQFRDRLEAVATYLAAAGLERGRRLHVHTENRPEFLLAWFAAARLGASIVPTNTGSSAHELAYVIEHAGAQMSLTELAHAGVVETARRRARSAGALVLCETAELLALPSAAPPEVVDPSPTEELAVLYTSGTTARPKGVRITNANYVYAGEVVAAGVRLTPADRVLTALPLFHANAQYYTTMGTLASGGTIVLLPRFSASRFMEQAIRHRATVASLFAAPIRMLLAQKPRSDWRRHSLRAVLFAQNLGRADLERWEARIGAPLVQLYGMTETIGPPLMNPVTGGARPDSVGRVSLGYTCRVVRDDGESAGIDEPGQLLVGGEPGVSLMAGYLNDDDASAAALEGGWLQTGDVVRVDAEGRFYFVDRRKDMVKRSGENVAASEVEAAIAAHPAVAEVAVVGVPDPIRDEEIVAFVVLHGGETLTPAELQAWCAQRLANFRVPGVVELRTILPLTPVGKIQKHLLRAEYLETNPQVEVVT